MALNQLFNKFAIPHEIRIYIYIFNQSKKEYNEVMNELNLQYNSGLWWLVQIRNNIPENLVEFTTFNDDGDICRQAILHEEILAEIIYKHSIKNIYRLFS